MLLSFLLKAAEDRGLSPIYHPEPKWYDTEEFGLVVIIIGVAMVIGAIYLFFALTDENRDEKKQLKRARHEEKREKEREELEAERERKKQRLEELSRCYITLVYCYNDKKEIIEHEREKVFNPNFPSREGYLFDGWYINTARTIPFNNDAVDEDIYLYAKWIKEAD